MGNPPSLHWRVTGYLKPVPGYEPDFECNGVKLQMMTARGRVLRSIGVSGHNGHISVGWERQNNPPYTYKQLVRDLGDIGANAMVRVYKSSLSERAPEDVDITGAEFVVLMGRRPSFRLNVLRSHVSIELPHGSLVPTVKGDALRVAYVARGDELLPDLEVILARTCDFPGVMMVEFSEKLPKLLDVYGQHKNWREALVAVRPPNCNFLGRTLPE